MASSVIPIPYGLDEIEKIIKDFDLFGIETHSISHNPRGLRAKRNQTPQQRANAKCATWPAYPAFGVQISPTPGPENPREDNNTSSGWTRHRPLGPRRWPPPGLSPPSPASSRPPSRWPSSSPPSYRPPPPPPPPPPQILLPPRRGAHAVSPSRAQVSILVLGAAAVFFEHIRKIGCMHS
jgi:hypothetical protein